MLVPPSPKSHCQEAGSPDVVSANCTVCPGPGVMGLNTKDAAASGMIMIVLTDFLYPALLAATKVTFRNPGIEYLWEGFWAVLVVPSPKSQSQEIGLPVEASTNWTVCPAVGYLGP